MTKLRIGGVPEHFNLPWRLAIEEGLFKKAGLYLHWEDMPGGTGQMTRGLASNSLDVAVLLTEGITKSILDGLPAKILNVYVNSPLRWGVHVPKGGDIQQIADLKGKTFAISRTGSGSHLMSYVMAHEQGWELHNLKFNIVGDIFGGLWALENNEAQAFLWERYTTKPYVEQGKCDYVGDVVTPWPCFCIAVRTEVYEQNKEVLHQMVQIVLKRAEKLKKDSQAMERIAWRYNLKLDDVRAWLNQTDWNYEGKIDFADFQKTADYLEMLKLITAAQKENLKEKLLGDD
ncbi:MAG: ABC transporter substrate-binding protein [Crocinitomicaceae bacterium]|nr:ABC transporter substrate-binding protein [Crocinitomicaceae bacterium]